MDDFKDFFRENKKKFSPCDPEEDMKLKVFVALEKKKQRKVVIMYRWLAAACLAAIVGLGALYLTKEKSNNPASEGNYVATPSIPAGDTMTEESPTYQEDLTPSLTLIEKDQPGEQNIASQKHSKIERRPVIEVSEISELEKSFTQNIISEKKKLEAIPVFAEEEKYFDSYKQRFAGLDKEEEKIKAMITIQGLQQNLLDELLSVYQGKMQLLLKLKLEVYKMNNKVFLDSVTVKNPYFITL